jgi:hypothetical protein
MWSMKLPSPNEVDAFGVVGAETDAVEIENKSSLGFLIAGSSPAFWLISARAFGPIFWH